MKGSRRILYAVMIAALLMLTVSAAFAAAPTITYEFNGGQYTDGVIDIEANLYYPATSNAELSEFLFPNGIDDLSVAQSFKYSWTLSSKIVADETHDIYTDDEFVDFALWAPTFFYEGSTLDEVNALMGQEVATCTISSNEGAVQYNVVFKLKGLESLPTFDWADDTRPEVSFVPGEEVTVVMEEPTFVEPREVYYHLLRIDPEDESANGSERLITNHTSSTFTFVAPESYDGHEFQVLVSFAPIDDETMQTLWSSNRRVVLRKTSTPATAPTTLPQPLNLSLVYDFTGYQYADGETQLHVNLMDAIVANDILMSSLFPNGVMDTANARANYDYFWGRYSTTPNSATHRMETSTQFSAESGWNGVTCDYMGMTAADAQSCVGKEIISAVIMSRDGTLNATVNFRLKELKHAPTFDYKGETPVYVSYVPGQKVTIETPKASFGGEQTAYYHLLREEEHDDGVWVFDFVTNQKSNVIAFTATAEMDGYRLVPDLSLEKWEDARHSWGAGVTYILQAQRVEAKVEEVEESAPLPEEITAALENLGIETYGELFTHMDVVLQEEGDLPQDVTVAQLTEHPMEITLVRTVGDKVEEVTEEYFKENDSFTVYMDAPKGTDVHGYTFYGVHTHQMDDMRGNRFKAGDTEVLDITIAGGQLCFEVTSLSPIKLYSLKNPEVVVPQTGDSANPLLWACCLLMGLGGCTVILRKTRRSHR